MCTGQGHGDRAACWAGVSWQPAGPLGVEQQPGWGQNLLAQPPVGGRGRDRAPGTRGWSLIGPGRAASSGQRTLALATTVKLCAPLGARLALVTGLSRGRGLRTEEQVHLRLKQACVPQVRSRHSWDLLSRSNLSAESGSPRGVGPTWAPSVPASTRAEPRTPDCELGDPSDSQGSRSGPPSTDPEALEIAPPPSAGTGSPGPARGLPASRADGLRRAKPAWGSAHRRVHPGRPTHGTGRSCRPRSGESSPAGASGLRGAPAPGPRPRPVPSGLTQMTEGTQGPSPRAQSSCRIPSAKSPHKDAATATI
ncbi:collagen alpha-1(I) chain-like [Phyllostomus hastatus]|uniref:collagen alpha-1(I) chain-like n=1 Tax=Phyllostomus hastatus TaxID=9423 RepID=UPI001E6825DC|nr:collagen alpha-1(I) chain-like [Phyllostomus hastatus]